MRLLERVLWSGRLIVLAAVVASWIVAVGVTYLVTVDVAYLIGQVAQYARPELGTSVRDALRLDLVGDVVGIIDGYLLAAVLVLFALGLYELFIGHLAFLEHSGVAARLLRVRSVDDLKDKLGRVVLLILVVKFSQLAMEMKYTEPIDLLYLSLGILLIGGGLFLTSHRAHSGAAHLLMPPARPQSETRLQEINNGLP
jgi:uncharacterized membrane protein YqhA